MDIKDNDPPEEGQPDELHRLLTDRLSPLPDDLRQPEPGSPRGRILEAARNLFADRGFQGTSIREIAQGADVNIAMVHYYFGSKELLYKRVFAYEIIRMFTIIRGEMERQVKQPEDAILLLPVLMLRMLRGNVIWRKLVRRELADGGDLIVQAVREMGKFGPKGFQNIARESYRIGVSNGRYHDLPFTSVLRYLVGSSYMIVLLAPMLEEITGESLENDRQFQAQIETIEFLIRRGLIKKETVSG